MSLHFLKKLKSTWTLETHKPLKYHLFSSYWDVHIRFKILTILKITPVRESPSLKYHNYKPFKPHYSSDQKCCVWLYKWNKRRTLHSNTTKAKHEQLIPMRKIKIFTSKSTLKKVRQNVRRFHFLSYVFHKAKAINRLTTLRVILTNFSVTYKLRQFTLVWYCHILTY